MHIEFIFWRNHVPILQVRWYSTHFAKVIIENWLTENMSDAKYEIKTCEDKMELRFTHASHYTEFALRFDCCDYRMVS